MPVILLAMYGRARSGKDTAANYLAEQLGLYKYAFAEPLKTMLKSVFGDHFHEGDRSGICPETGKSYREMMQTLGTEWGRNLMSDDVWVRLVQKKWDWLHSGVWYPGMWSQGCQGMILSDLRFDSEAEWVRSNGGYVIEIKRDDDKPTQGICGHQSEAGIREDLIDLLCMNHGTLENLHTLLDVLVGVIKTPGLPIAMAGRR